MRFTKLLPALLMLVACDQAPGNAKGPAPDATEDAATALIPAGGTFDYRYAFRLPAAKIKAVQDSHVRGCEQLGPARCRINATRYRVGDDNKIAAVTTLMLDPGIARAFGEAATRTVTSAQGVLVDARIAGASPAGSGAALVARLRTALADASKQAATAAPDQRAAYVAKAQRLSTALATIGEIEGGDPQSNATTPLLVTYASGTVSPAMGASPDATFQAAGQTFLASLGGLVSLLAGPAPFIVLMVIAVLILRRFVHADEEPVEAAPVHAAPEHKNVIQRWIHRDEDTPARDET
ncbi:hypothetical protein BH09PSE4_BH09PSE4_04060 [soil metagenome]